MHTCWTAGAVCSLQILCTRPQTGKCDSSSDTTCTAASCHQTLHSAHSRSQLVHSFRRCFPWLMLMSLKRHAKAWSGTWILGNDFMVGMPEWAAEASAPLHPEVSLMMTCTSMLIAAVTMCSILTHIEHHLLCYGLLASAWRSPMTILRYSHRSRHRTVGRPASVW